MLFISYAAEDRPFVRSLSADVSAAVKGLACNWSCWSGSQGVRGSNPLSTS